MTVFLTPHPPTRSSPVRSHFCHPSTTAVFLLQTIPNFWCGTNPACVGQSWSVCNCEVVCSLVRRPGSAASTPRTVHLSDISQSSVPAAFSAVYINIFTDVVAWCKARLALCRSPPPNLISSQTSGRLGGGGGGGAGRWVTWMTNKLYLPIGRSSLLSKGGGSTHGNTHEITRACVGCK